MGEDVHPSPRRLVNLQLIVRDVFRCSLTITYRRGVSKVTANLKRFALVTLILQLGIIGGY